VGRLGRSIGIASIVGVAGGLAAILFQWTIHFVRSAPLAPTAEGLGSSPVLWVALTPALGGLLAGLAIWRWAPEAEGHGTEQMVQTFHRKGGVVRKRVALVKTIASALTIGSGGSAGQEGPVAQIGSGVGSSLSNAFNLSARDRRTFLLAGASAGIGAMFSAPLGAAMFAPEVLYKKSEYEGEAVVPCIVASIIAYTTKTSLGGAHRAVEIPRDVLERLTFGGARELIVYVALALAVTVVGWTYVRTFGLVQRGFERLTRLSKPLRVTLGGLLLGLLALGIAPIAGEHGVLFGGYELIDGSIDGSIAIGALLLLIPAKILATSLSIGSGGSGGLFAPSLAIGALVGCAVGMAARTVPGFESVDPAAVALVGAGGFFAGVANTPIAATIIVCEMTGGYALLAPLLLVAVVHYVLARNWTIYESQVEGIVDSPAHAGEFVIDVLERMPVSDVIDREKKVTLVSENATLRKALSIVATSSCTYFPVVDGDDGLVGIFSLSDVRRIFLASGVEDLVIVRDFMVDRVETVRAADSLDRALRKLNELAIHEIPVVEGPDGRHVVAMLSRNNIGAAYHKRLAELRRASA
jgi:CIC family chloride channel protein